MEGYIWLNVKIVELTLQVLENHGKWQDVLIKKEREQN
jgi:hypothetical protein